MLYKRPGASGANSARTLPESLGQARADPVTQALIYEQLLRDNLEGALQGFVPFFANQARLRLLDFALRRHFKSTPADVLNIGCGPFATEFFLKPLAPHRIVSFDYTQGFGDLFPVFRACGYLQNTRFFVASALDVTFPANSFDLVIMHDVLYERALPFDVMFEKYDAYLRPGGLIFFDLMDVRMQKIWKKLGKEADYQRYDIGATLAYLQARGYQVLECLPSLKAVGLANKLFRRVLWHGFRRANSFAIMARKREAC